MGRRSIPGSSSASSTLAAGTDYRVVAVLIEQTKFGQPAPFYIMRDKVWAGLFRAFADENPGKVPTSKRTRGEDQDFLPALGVTGPEAEEFAAWLGGPGRGFLPTCPQWDQAAGKNDGSTSPFRGVCDPSDPAGPAVGGTARAVNRVTCDVSIHGCRDMSGNGLEWTRLPPGQTRGYLVDLPHEELHVQPAVHVQGYDPG